MPRRYESEITAHMKKAAGLQLRSHRVRYEQAVIEGPQSVRELLRYQPELIRDVYITERGIEAHRDIDRLLLAVDPYTHIVPDSVMADMSGAAQGFLAVINIPDEEPLEAILDRKPGILVCAMKLSDPGNLGTIIRAADACGVGGVILGSGSVEVMNPKVLRSTAGSVFHVSILEDEDVVSVVSLARAAGYQVLAADAGGKWDLGVLSDAAVYSTQTDRAFGSPRLTVPTMWLLGNEAHGFTAAERELADEIVSIPMWGSAESLNVAMASTLCLYASALAQNRKTKKS